MENIRDRARGVDVVIVTDRGDRPPLTA